VPLFITSRRDLKKDGSNPTMLYGYGGFDISETPRFRPDVIAFLEQGGVYATANMRGGGEYGEAWHEAGMLERKQNVFDDFIAAAEYLIAEHIASPRTLASWADRTADCWSASPSNSARISLPSRCLRSA
jgi:prolyl oligopeptidase